MRVAVLCPLGTLLKRKADDGLAVMRFSDLWWWGIPERTENKRDLRIYVGYKGCLVM